MILDRKPLNQLSFKITSELNENVTLFQMLSCVMQTIIKHFCDTKESESSFHQNIKEG